MDCMLSFPIIRTIRAGESFDKKQGLGSWACTALRFMGHSTPARRDPSGEWRSIGDAARILPIGFHGRLEHLLRVNWLAGVHSHLVERNCAWHSARTKTSARLLLQKCFQFSQINVSVMIVIREWRRKTGSWLGAGFHAGSQQVVKFCPVKKSITVRIKFF